MTSAEYDRAVVAIGKVVLASLPVANYKGEIIVVDQPHQIIEMVDNLKNAEILGFDTETRPSFRKGTVYKTALIQLSTKEKSFLIRTNVLGYPKEVIEILEDPKILKVGLSIHDDFHNLKKVVEDFNPKNFIDLQSYVKEFKIADNSLSKLYGILFDERISKGQRLSNWEADQLSEAQQSYAALDAYACIKIYEYLKEGKFNVKESKYLILPSLTNLSDSIEKKEEC